MQSAEEACLVPEEWYRGGWRGVRDPKGYQPDTLAFRVDVFDLRSPKLAV